MQIEDYLYQKKLHEPLTEAKHIGMKAEDRALLDRQALGAVRLSLAKNVAYNVVNEKTTYGLFQALSNMYEKPSASNKVFLIRQLVNTKMKEGASVADHVNKFNSILSRKTSGEYLNSLLSAKNKGRKQDRGQKQNRSRSKSKKRGQSKNRQDITCWNCNQKGHFQNQCSKPVTSRDKEVNIAVRDYDDSLDVRYIPCLKKRLISVGQLDEEGYHIGFGYQQWKVTKGSLVVARRNKRGSLYMVEVPSDGINAAIDGLQKAVVGFCEPCVLGKQKKVSFIKSGNTRKLQRLELVHTDVYGPTFVASIGGSRYYVTFIDDSSRKVWVYFLKNKSEVFNTFKKWKAAVENETNLRVKCLKSDNGGEYSSRDFIEYCAKNGIRMLKTVPETPQQNGVAERMNRTLNERAKSMRLHAGLPKMFWEDSAMAQMRWDIAFGIRRVTRSSEADMLHLMRTLYMEPRLQQILIRVRGPTTVGASRIVEDRMKKTLKIKHPLRREALRLHSYKDPPKSLGLRLIAGKKALQSKWVFRVKEEQDGKKRYKARLVVKGFQQKQGVDYNEIFSPVVKMTTIRLVLSIVAAENLHLEQLDVKTAFLHGDLDEDIYMTQPEGFQSAGKEENLVCKLKKSLYGLKQAPRQWYLKFDSFMQRAGYKRCAMDHCCYLKKVGSSSIILLLYVDDMLVAGSDMAKIKKLKRQLSQEFEMKDLGPAKQILGMSIIRDRTKGTLRLSQEKYIGKVLEKFNMKDAEARCQPLGDHFKLSKKQAPKTEASRRRMAKVPYASAVGSVMYTMVCTRPDIAHVVGVVSRFTSNPGRKHWEAVKWLLRYLKVGGTTVSWMSRIQKCVAMSTTEAEYMAIAEAGKELVWLKNFLEELDRAQTECVLFCDNQSAIHLAKNPVFHGTLSMKKILGAKNPADMLTKVVTTKKLKLCAALTGLRDN
ncbi:retrovirus-related pol polyprotein from transposon TNT 1-94 [Tanacetum coccineum]